jgi:hypothetical protein
MFFIRHPKPVVDPRAVAMLVVQQKATQAVSRTLIVVDKPSGQATQPVPAADGAKMGLE